MNISRFYTLCALAALAAGSASAAPAAVFKHTKATSVKAEGKALRTPAKEQSGALWRPGHQEISAWEGEWVLTEVYNTTYTAAGKPAIETMTDMFDQSATRETTTYNANDMLAEQIIEVSTDGETFTNSMKTQRTYDSVVTDFITANYGWLWLSDAWDQIGNNYTHTITRNTDGYITGIERAVLYMGALDPIMRISIEYGADGKASTITQSDLEYDYDTDEFAWNESHKITDIQWDRTDNQITSTEISELTSGNNRILSGHLVNSENDVDFNVTYTENGYTFVRTGMIQGYEAKATVEYTLLDANGSEMAVETFEMDEDGEPYIESYTDIIRMDAWGYITEMKYTYEFGDETEILDNIIGELTYDSTYGYPLTYTTSMMELDEETDEPVMVPNIYTEFSEYIDAASASVEDITVAEEDAEAEYFNLQGMPVSPDRLVPGIYIVRRGDTVSKQVLR